MGGVGGPHRDQPPPAVLLPAISLAAPGKSHGLSRPLDRRQRPGPGRAERRRSRHHPARCPIGPLPKGQQRVRPGHRSAFVLRSAARPSQGREDHAARPADRRPLRLGGRVIRRGAGDGPQDLSGDRDSGGRQRGVVMAIESMAAADRTIPGIGGRRAADRRQPPSGHPDPRDRNVERTGRTTGRARVAPSGQAGRPQGRRRASRSIFRSAVRMSPK